MGSGKKKRHPPPSSLPVQEDPRFAAAAIKPQFRPAFLDGKKKSSKKKSESKPKSGVLVGLPDEDDEEGTSQKIEIDERFQSILTDGKFSTIPGEDGGGVDKYGRKKKKKKKKTKEKDRKKNDKDESNDDDDDDDEKMTKKHASADQEKEQNDSESDDDDSSTAEDDNHVFQSNDPEARIAYLTALSRGEISGDSSDDSSDSDEDSSDDSDDDSYASSSSQHVTPGVLDPSHVEDYLGDGAAQAGDEIEISNVPTTYMAILNMDWKYVRAVDLLLIASSFGPPGSVKSLKVYLSDFGKERIEKEKVAGPVGIWKKSKKDQANTRTSSISQQEGSDTDASSSSEEEEEEEGDSDNDNEINLLDAYKHFPNENQAQDTSSTNKNYDDDDANIDIEKLRNYEASKLKYYFAILETNTPTALDTIYNELDGLELEHSSAAMDCRSIPPNELMQVVLDTNGNKRDLRDEAYAIPSNYEPPSFVVQALQQTNVRCTWEDGNDVERDSKLTQWSNYGVGSEAWNAMLEGDDLKAYMASSESEADDDDDEDGGRRVKSGAGTKKAANMRKLLGLGSGSDSDDDDHNDDGNLTDSSSDVPSSDSEESDINDDGGYTGKTKQASFIPGKSTDLQEKIKIMQKQARNPRTKEEEEEALKPKTSWAKYIEKRKEKKREKRAARRTRRKNVLEDQENERNDEDMYDDDPEFGNPDSASDDDDDNKNDQTESNQDDDFFAEESGEGGVKKSKSSKKNKGKSSIKEGEEDAVDNDDDDDDVRKSSTKEELALLLAGDDDEEAAMDYDMRGLIKMHKKQEKSTQKLQKRKTDRLEAAGKNAPPPGTDFQINTSDARFTALLEGSDSRFGIDKSDANYKDTPAMKEILAEQTKRRKKKRRRSTNKNDDLVVSADVSNSGSGGMELSSLVQSLKKKVNKHK